MIPTDEAIKNANQLGGVMTERLNDSAIDSALKNLPAWELCPERRSITRDFKFGNFNQAFGFMVRGALLAEKMNHHPEWQNSYARVAVRLTTHSVKGLSALDIKMAQAMDQFYAEMGSD